MALKRGASFVMALICLLCFAGTAEAAEVESGSVYCFCQEDFSGEGNLTGICITDVPEKMGTVMLGDRTLKPGDILTAEQAAQMTFSPVRTERDKTAQVGFLPIYENKVEEEAAMTIGIRGKENHMPVAEDQTLETYKNLSTQGKLKVSDPEGEAMKFQVVRGAKRGDVTIREDGTFTYTPKKNKVGVDSFTYTAQDLAGKVSREATVTITILKPTDMPQYQDTMGQACRFAAEWMKHTGIFVGEQVGESACFMPERPVTRGEFVTMLIKALDIPVEEEVTQTGFEDEIPAWLQPYLAAAVRSGITSQLQDQHIFGANEPIAPEDAAALLCGALDLTAAQTMAEEAPGSESGFLLSLEKEGICLQSSAPVTRGEAAMALYQAAQRCK